MINIYWAYMYFITLLVCDYIQIVWKEYEMKSIKSVLNWILFVPVCAMSVALITICGLNPDSINDIFATDLNGIAEIIAFSVLGLFLACFVFSLFDRKTSPVHLLKKNYFCGALAFVSAFGLVCTAALDVTAMIQLGTITVMPIVTAVFAALSGLGMLFIGINHFTGANTPRNLSMLFLSLPLWCGVHLIDRFMKHTAMPVAAADTMDLIMFVALAMFFINATMIHSVIPGKNAVKSALNYGFPAVVISLVYGISLIFNTITSDSNALIDYIPAGTYIILGLYVLGFVSELSFKAKTVEEQMIVVPETEEETSDEYEESEGITEKPYEEEISTETVAVTDTVSEEVIEEVVEAEDPVGEESDAPEETSFTTTEDYEQISLFDDDSADSASIEYSDETDTESIADDDIPVHLPEVEEEDDPQCDIAEELFREAQERDAQKAKEQESQPALTESDDEMIIDEESTVAAPAARPVSSEHRPKGRTIRETVVYDDEDFILGIDSSGSSEFAGRTEDISTYVLDDTSSDLSKDGQSMSYSDRLDEIDQLIISIQGGDSSAEE